MTLMQLIQTHGQPIATAPHDGTPILAYQPAGTDENGKTYPESVGIALWQASDAYPPGYWSGPSGVVGSPTLWMRMGDG